MPAKAASGPCFYLASSRKRAMQHQSGPTQLALPNFQPEPMQVHDRRNDRQSQPKPGMAMAFIAAIEPLQHRSTLFFGNARPAVLDSQVHAGVVVCRANSHLATLGRELDTVAHQVGQCLEQQFAVTVQCRQLRGLVQCQVDAAILGQRQ